jgi:hypothetical protein
MDPRITHHSQPNFTAREQAPGEHRASSRRAQSKLQEGTEKNRGVEALTRCPEGTTVAWRGSACVATTAPSQGKAPMSRRQSTTPTSTRARDI